MANNSLNFPGVNAKLLCWKCDSTMVKQPDKQGWKCPKCGVVCDEDGRPVSVLVKKT